MVTSAIDDLENYANERQISFAEALERYSVVGANYDPAHGSYMIMADRTPAMETGIAISELGYASPSPWTAWTREERVPELRDQQGLRTYYDMKRADGTVRGALRLLKTPILAARWFVEPATDSVTDKNIAHFIEKNLFDEMNVPWSRVIEDALLMCDYGYFPFELVFTMDSGKLKLQKMAPRHPMDIDEWEWDVNGGPNGIFMLPANLIDYRERIFIPIEKLVVFALEQEGGDLRGLSILRSAYKHYYYKDCTDAQTEIFTQDGWKTHDQILPGDKTLSINEKTGLSEWDEIQFVKRYPGTHEMIRMESSQFSSLTTPDHRWLTKFKGGYRWRTTETLTHDDNIPRIGECIDIPMEAKYTDEFVELAAWLWTEGCVLNEGFKISQSYKVNPNNVNRIRRALTAICPNPVKGHRNLINSRYWSESSDRNVTGTKGMTDFYLGKEIAKEFWSILKKHKVISPLFITSLTRAQLELFVRVSLLGDGYLKPKAGGPIVTQENEEQLIALQMACSLLGIPTSLKKYSVRGYSDRWILNLQKNIFTNPRKAADLAKARGYKDGMTITKEYYQGIVWCPKTRNGNWLAKRKGTVFTTGNTLYKIDAIQKERHGIGIPIIKLPPGFSNDDRKIAEDLGRNLRTNERAHIVAPSNWDIMFAKLEGQIVDCIRSIEHHDMKIKANILAPFMDEANVQPDSLDIYYKSTRYIANTVCDTFNHFVIPKLVDFNFVRGGYPKLRVRRIGEWEDIRTMSFAFRNFVGAAAIRPDDDLEDFLRRELDLPPVDKSSIRTVVTPTLDTGRGSEQALIGQAASGGSPDTSANQPGTPNAPIKPSPPQVGLPRQSKPKAQLPKKSAGNDTSGGK